jgi:hypothetical protein
VTASLYRDLYQIGSVAGIRAVLFRVALAVALPLIGGVLLGHPVAAVCGGATALFVTLSDVGNRAGVRLGTMLAGWMLIVLGGTLGHLLGDTPYGREAVVLLAALVAGWASGSHPGIAAVTRFFAVATAAGAGMRFHDPDVLLNVLLGGVSALVTALAVWGWFRIPSHQNYMDWRAGVRRAYHGADAGVRFALCYAAAAAVALFAASALGVKESFWATLVVLMVMRREGIACLELTIHYALGTIVGVVASAAVLRFVSDPLALAVLATLVAAFARVGFSLNPCLGYTSFTMFLLFIEQVIAGGGAAIPHMFETRLYDVSVGSVLALAGTLAAIYPRFSPAPTVAPRHKERSGPAGRPHSQQ